MSLLDCDKLEAEALAPISIAPVRRTDPHRFAINGRFLCQPVTGVQRVAREIVREVDALIADGELAARVELICPPDSDLSGLRLRAIEVRPVGRFRDARWEQLTLPVHCDGVPLLCLGNTAPLRALFGPTPVAVMIHDLSYLQFRQAYRLSYRMAHRMMLPALLRKADLIFTVSGTEEARIRRIAPDIGQRLRIAPNGARSWEPGALTDRPVPFGGGYGLYVGAFSRRKNFDRVLEVAIQLAREDACPFVFVGSAPDILCQPRIVVPRDVRHLLHFAGQVDNIDQLGALYRGARYLLFPSLYEASPLPPLEAALFGCPVVASNVASIWERCGEGVEYCDPLRTETIAAAARKVMAGGPVIERQIAANRSRAQIASWKEQARIVSSAMVELCVRQGR